MAGGGVKADIYGATDDIGYFAVETHAHSISMTVLHLMGLDHTPHV
jgi:hypothetical protein